MIRTVLFCDGCGETLGFGREDSDKSISELRREAREAGWIWHQKREDFCPSCVDNKIVDLEGKA